MLRLAVRSEIGLSQHPVERDVILWLEAAIEDSRTGEGIGAARVAVVRAADAMNFGISVRDALTDSLRELGELFFEGQANCLKPRFQNAVGWNLVYFDSVNLLPSWSGHEVERTAVQRIVDIWGEGSAIAVMRISDDAASRRWQPLGFELVRAPSSSSAGYVYRDLSQPWPSLAGQG